MISTRVFQSVLGVQTGDVVRTEFGPDRIYSSGPYEVWSIGGPVYVTDGPFYVTNSWDAIVIRDYPVISLTCINPGHPQPDMYSLTWYRLEGSRYLDDRDGELFIVERAAQVFQADLFSANAPEPEPYPFDPNVEYRGVLPAWKCVRGCGRDFNADYRRSAPGHHLTYSPACNHCGQYSCKKLHYLSRPEAA